MWPFVGRRPVLIGGHQLEDSMLSAREARAAEAVVAAAKRVP